MHPIVRIVGIGFVFSVTAIAWLVFGSVMDHRTQAQTEELRGRVSDLWGSPQRQTAPDLTFLWDHEVEETHTEVVDGVSRTVAKRVVRTEELPQSLASTTVTADLRLDQRLKGLMWYALYDVDFAGRWTYAHQDERAGTLRVGFAFPDAEGMFDGFRFVVNGVDRAGTLRPIDGRITFELPVRQGDEVSLEVEYRSRGMGEWRYQPATGVASLEDFSLTMTTDFADIDYPTLSMSPSSRARSGGGWRLSWTFDRIVTGHQVGMVMPVPTQPGELASQLSYSAPISLLFFFLVLFVLGTMRGIDIHPINYLFLGAAFFAFHLVFGYGVDHLNVVAAFAVASVVSIVLVVTYLRLVVSSRFAFVEAGAAQLVYLVGFSLAHFWDGFTGLTVTVLSVVTLFLLMQLTGRVRWSEALSGGTLRPAATDPAAGSEA
jgi:inner membrane protein involved in colicin E2 resistance